MDDYSGVSVHGTEDVRLDLVLFVLGVVPRHFSVRVRFWTAVASQGEEPARIIGVKPKIAKPAEEAAPCQEQNAFGGTRQIKLALETANGHSSPSKLDESPYCVFILRPDFRDTKWDSMNRVEAVRRGRFPE
jgi:hypothetical protein